MTVAVDVHSRIVTGCHLSLDPPSATSVALCMAQSILPKEALLLEHGIQEEWPVWGFPAKVHVDNASEFRSKDLRKACEFHDIDLEFRPVKRPRYGGHIERLIGTFMTAVHGLPGTTYSSPAGKGDLDPEKRAAMTFSEFERWLLGLVCTVYHRTVHSGIGMTPLQKWHDGWCVGQGDLPATGLPARPDDRDGILRSFLPSFERTVQRAGVEIDGVRYFSEALIRLDQRPGSDGRPAEAQVRLPPRSARHRQDLVLRPRHEDVLRDPRGHARISDTPASGSSAKRRPR